jgi:uncharacterized OB-fold protein
MDVTEVSDREVIAKFPDVYIDHDNKDYWKGKLQKRLLMNRCQDCGYWIYPFRPGCPECWSDNVSAEEVSGNGFIYLLVFYHQGREIAGVTYWPPYAVAAVELEEREGLRYVAPIVNAENANIEIGMPVELTWIERDGVPAPAFQPAEASRRTNGA